MNALNETFPGNFEKLIPSLNVIASYPLPLTLLTTLFDGIQCFAPIPRGVEVQKNSALCDRNWTFGMQLAITIT